MTDETPGVDRFRNPEINDTDLNKELCEQAASVAHVGRLYAEADAEHETYKLRVKQLAASIDEQIRQEAKEKKITEAAIAKEIERHPDYIRAMEHQIKLNKRKEELRSLRDSWRDRTQLLIQRCVNERSEREAYNNSTVRSLNAVD